MAFAVLMVSAVAGGFMGCGGSTPQKVSGAGGTTGGTAGSGAAGTGTAGTGTTGSAGTTGTAGDGTGAAGSTAGTTGTAGAGGGATAGTTGAAGVAGTAGDSGAAGTTAPAPAYCDTHTKKALPYNIGGDFTSIQTLAHASQTWKQIGNPDCDQTVFPPLNPSDGGTDGGADGGADAALALNDDAAADAPVDAPVDGGSVDAPADVVTNPIPACFEFTYNPDPCVAATGLSATAALGTCYAGTIFQPAGNLLGAADQGICIGDGATQVTFQARANVNGQIIKFGSTREGLNQTEFYITLSTTWTTYHTAIPAGEPYNMSSNLGGVWNGFSVVGEPQSNVGGTYILIRNITWSQ